MSRIGIDARLFGPRVGGGGLGRYVEQLILNLEQLDHENEYIIFLGKENWNEYQPKNPNFKKIMAPWRWYTLAEQIHLPRLIDSTRLNLVHYPHFNVPLLARTPFVVTIHDLNLLEYPKAGISNLDPIRFWSKYIGFRLVLAGALRHAQKIIAVSEATRDSILKYFPTLSEKIAVIHPGYTPPLRVRGGGGSYDEMDNPSPPPLTLRGGAISSSYLLTVGNAYPHKNLSGLLHAFKIIHENIPELKLTLVGPEDRFRASIKKETHDLGLESNVVFPGFVSDEELDTLYRSAAALVFPSFLEGFGFPGLEAQGRGTPVVASDLPVLHETLGEAAVYFNPRDPRDIAYAVLNLLKNETLQDILKKDGLENIKRFDWKQTARRTITLYRELRPLG